MIDVAFIAWIRPERKFDTVDALIACMHDDCALARDALGRVPAAFPPVPVANQIRTY